MNDSKQCQNAAHLLFHLAFFGFALLLELFTKRTFGYDPSCCTFSRGLWSGLIFEKVCMATYLSASVTVCPRTTVPTEI